MLTATVPKVESTKAHSRPNQNETIISDQEISRRVLSIRAGWSVAERIERRQEAERRFAELLDKLTAA